MSERASPVIGILGGMGPAATADFYRKLVLATPAVRDQEHPRALIWSDPSIPDRASAYLHGGASPIPGLIDGARRLEDSGADFIAVPCNTAHLYLEPVREQVDVPVLDMIDATARALALRHERSRVALLGTAATVRSGIYRTAFECRGLLSVEVHAAEQQLVSAAIAAVKAGDVLRAAELLAPVLEALERRGADAIVGGCTELPLAAEHLMVGSTFVDPSTVLAGACLDRVRSLTPDSVLKGPLAS
ncbi:amino acid racemase [uncultured Agrococcus sp.]|uniref:aspartate/glutamate racemase family protein n=1 Tax=uncultured Agrococcus sp. TaxID=382258 RepID=UPI0025D66EC4|nr:amino acid racemase [uncultured Agrococcus sp.]